MSQHTANSGTSDPRKSGGSSRSEATATGRRIRLAAAAILGLLALAVLAFWAFHALAGPDAAAFELVMVRPEGGGKHHKAIADRTVTLKAVIRAEPGTRFLYEWDFGDDTAGEKGLVKDPYNVGTKHDYEDAKAGDEFTAVLTVTNRETGHTISGEYPIRFVEPALPDSVDIAVEDGLWAIHCGAERVDSPEAGQAAFWERATHQRITATAMNIHTLQVLGHTVAGDERVDPYVEDVRRGLNGLAGEVRFCDVSASGRRDPDGNENRRGLRVTPSHAEVMDSASVLLALATSHVPARKVVGPPAEEVGGTVPAKDTPDGLTFRELVQEIVDYLAFSQNDEATTRGGWGIAPNSGNADITTSGWVVLGLLAAEDRMAARLPEWLKTELLKYLTETQSEEGAFALRDDPENVTATALGLTALSYCDLDATDQRITKARDVISAQWSSDNLGCFQMYAVSQAAQTASPAIFKFGDHDWRAEYKELLVKTQAADGIWPAQHANFPSTSVALLVLREKAVKSGARSLSLLIWILGSTLAVALGAALAYRVVRQYRAARRAPPGDTQES